jgi:hypothetical protein
MTSSDRLTADEAREEQTFDRGRSRVEEFLRAVEGKTTDAFHRRLLRACRELIAGPAMEAELGKIVTEILRET